MRDNGNGFPSAALRNGGSGLKNMRSRAAKIGADLRLDSSQEGTKIRIITQLGEAGAAPKA